MGASKSKEKATIGEVAETKSDENTTKSGVTLKGIKHLEDHPEFKDGATGKTEDSPDVNGETESQVINGEGEKSEDKSKGDADEAANKLAEMKLSNEEDPITKPEVIEEEVIKKDKVEQLEASEPDTTLVKEKMNEEPVAPEVVETPELNNTNDESAVETAKVTTEEVSEVLTEKPTENTDEQSVVEADAQTVQEEPVEGTVHNDSVDSVVSCESVEGNNKSETVQEDSKTTEEEETNKLEASNEASKNTEEEETNQSEATKEESKDTEEEETNKLEASNEESKNTQDEKTIVDFVNDDAEIASDSPKEADTLAAAALVKHEFTWEHGGQEVFIAGTFNDWQEVAMEQKDEIHKIELEISPGKHEFHYKVDGEVQTNSNLEIEEGKNVVEISS